jgi:hypothetical protein
MLENDVGKCQLLDVIPKQGNYYRDVLDMKINFSSGDQSSGFLFLCESQAGI